jgi:DNA-binding NtrC family response regulator
MVMPDLATREAGPAKPATEWPSVAVVDDDADIRKLVAVWLEHAGYRCVPYADGREVLEAPLGELSAVCLDLLLGEVSGLDVLSHLVARDPDLPVIVITSRSDVDTAVQAMRSGAYDYAAKPLDRRRLLSSLAHAVERRDLVRRVEGLRQQLHEKQGPTTLVGQSVPMRELLRQVERLQGSEVPICLMGESGTGKELVARGLHASGRRKGGPFVAINCAAIPAALQESELFGHEKGAFTGAARLHRGCFEQAQDGTLFLDEIGEMSPGAQASVLRALQERVIRRVGGVNDITVNPRIISATNRDLAGEVKAGRFRQDLYYRLVVYPLQVPPLRARTDDIPLLVGHFLHKLGPDVGRTIHRIHPDALDALVRHDWPGNVRELENVVHRAMLCCDADQIALGDLPGEIRELRLPPLPARSRPSPELVGEGSAAGGSAGGAAAGEDGVDENGGTLTLAELERRAIRRALSQAGGNVAWAAKLLGISRATLYRRLSGDGRADDGTPET